MKLKVPLNELKLAFIDCETTGLNIQKHEIIEVATLIYDPISDSIMKEWESKIAPSNIENADPESLEINGYNKNSYKYKGNLKSAMIKFNSLVKDCLICGQNVSFDLGFIYKSMENFGIEPTFNRRYIDLMGLAWFAIRNSNISGLGLDSMCKHFDISNIGAHTALVDCRRTFQVYKKIEKALGA